MNLDTLYVKSFVNEWDLIKKTLIIHCKNNK